MFKPYKRKANNESSAPMASPAEAEPQTTKASLPPMPFFF